MRSTNRSPLRAPPYGGQGWTGSLDVDDAATLRLDTVEAVLPFDQLSPERVILLVERVLLSPTAGARRSHLRRLTDAQAATGVRLAPWEAALVR